MGANMAVRRDLAVALGGFDPRLDVGTLTRSGGDTDMFARMLDAGAAIAYTPAALVWHRHRDDHRELRSVIFGYGTGLYAMLTKRLVECGDARALVVAARWFAGPIVKALRGRLRGERTVPASLLVAEAGGALLGPLMYFRERARRGGPPHVLPC
jgi:GT2 family glycosyltransferase